MSAPPRQEPTLARAAATDRGAAGADQGATKPCPFCAETIKAAAIVCRFCGRTLPPTPAARHPLAPPDSAAPSAVPAKKRRGWGPVIVVLVVPIAALVVGALLFGKAPQRPAPAPVPVPPLLLDVRYQDGDLVITNRTRGEVLRRCDLTLNDDFVLDEQTLAETTAFPVVRFADDEGQRFNPLLRKPLRLTIICHAWPQARAAAYDFEP